MQQYTETILKEHINAYCYRWTFWVGTLYELLLGERSQSWYMHVFLMYTYTIA